MEKLSRILSNVMLAAFALLFGLALLLGGCQPEHLSYCVAFALGVAGAALYALWQRRPLTASTLWERLGRRRTAALLLALCFLLHLAWVLFFRLEPAQDYRVIWDAAAALAAGEPLADRVYLAENPDLAGYAAILSVFLRIFGTGALAAPILNVCLTTLSGFFLYRIMLLWRGENSAALVLLLWSLYPSKLLYNTLVLAEPWYTCMLLAALWIVVTIETRKPRFLITAPLGVLAGVLLRLSGMAGPVSGLAVLALVIWVLLLRDGRDRESREHWRGFTILLLAVWLLTGPVWDNCLDELLADPAAPGETIEDLLAEDTAFLTEESVEWLNPPQENIFIRLRNSLGFDEGAAYQSRARLRDRAYQLLALYSNIWYYALGILAVWGCWRIFRAGERRTVLLVPQYGLFLALRLTGSATARLHYSLIPMLILLAAFSYTRPVRRS